MKHKIAGINKNISEPVYAADILSDTAYLACKGLARGAWLQTLLHIWRNKTDRLSGTVPDFALWWGLTPAQVRECIWEFAEHKPCEVEIKNCDVSRFVTESHDLHGCIVTLVNRRKQRAIKARKQATLRKQRQRGNEMSRSCHADVLSEKPLPSSSSSPSVTKVTMGAESPKLFLSELDKKKKAKEAKRKQLIQKYGLEYQEHRERFTAEWQKAQKLREEIETLNDQIANYGEK